MKTLVITVIFSAVILLILLLAMGIKAIFIKNGRFPSSHACGYDFKQKSKRD